MMTKNETLEVINRVHSGPGSIIADAMCKMITEGRLNWAYPNGMNAGVFTDEEIDALIFYGVFQYKSQADWENANADKK